MNIIQQKVRERLLPVVMAATAAARAAIVPVTEPSDPDSIMLAAFQAVYNDSVRETSETYIRNVAALIAVAVGKPAIAQIRDTRQVKSKFHKVDPFALLKLVDNGNPEASPQFFLVTNGKRHEAMTEDDVVNYESHYTSFTITPASDDEINAYLSNINPWQLRQFLTDHKFEFVLEYLATHEEVEEFIPATTEDVAP